MTIRKHLANLLLFVSSVFASIGAYAATAAESAQATSFMHDILGATPSSTDLADQSLVMLFGTFIFKPFGGYPGTGEVTTVLSQVLGYSNIVAMILGVVILSYTILGGAVKTAADGQLLGQGWSSVWLPMRTATAFGLITPVSDGQGVFSVAQSLVVWMVIVGSNAGTWVWEKGAEVLTVGSPAIPTTAVYDFNAYRNVVEVLHCSVVRHKYLVSKGVSGAQTGNLKYSLGSNATVKKFSYSSGYTLNFAELKTLNSISFTDCGTIAFPNNTNVMGVYNSATSGTTAEKTTLSRILNTQSWEDTIRTNYESNIPTAYLAFLNNVLGKVVTLSDGPTRGEIEAALTNYSSNPADKAVYDKVATNAATLNEIGSAYRTYIAEAKNKIVTPDIASQWKTTMKEGGWMAAGAWFFEASRLQSVVYNYLTSLTSSATYEGKATNYVTGCGFFHFTSCDSAAKDQESQLQRIEALQKVASTSSTGSSSTQVIELSAGASGTLDAGFFSSVSSAIATMFMNGLMNFGSTQAVGSSIGLVSGMTTNTSGMLSPFTAISSMGRGLQSINETIWAIGLVAAGMAGGADNAAGALPLLGAAGGGVAGVLRYLIATLVPLMGALLGMSFVMAMAIPFMPVITWIMMCCGYLLTVIEAVAAAPLAVIMMATPEGDGISGQNMQKALQMINAIILRPTLSIVGLFAAMTLSYVGFSLMNTLFWKVAGMNTSLGLYEIIGLITIYISMTMKMCEYMISVMYKIPDQILDWMGGGVSRPFGEQESIGEMKGALGKGSNLNESSFKAVKGEHDRSVAKARWEKQRKFYDSMMGEDDKKE
ncbi:DotA/TraY family protein [Pseudomonas sp. Leaf58]|uniref:DotA/TraY family protein n=1 Tax=unclassified Pseudomonas TaxID=196821 RepID=UPI0009EAFB59|nr:DotA/TraY family protein [Pseudomonas sp. Leaf58]